MTEFKAVVTADIVNSGKLSAERFEELIKRLKQQMKKDDIRADFYRGDSFHFLSDAGEAFEQTLRLRLICKLQNSGSEGIDLRAAIGLEQVSMPVKSLSLAQDKAFILSGRELDVLSNNNRRRFSIKCSFDMANEAFYNLALFCDFILNDMSFKQAEVLLESLRGANQEEIASMLGKTQPTVNKLLLNANYDVLNKLIDSYKRISQNVNSLC